MHEIAYSKTLTQMFWICLWSGMVPIYSNTDCCVGCWMYSVICFLKFWVLCLWLRNLCKYSPLCNGFLSLTIHFSASIIKIMTQERLKSCSRGRLFAQSDVVMHLHAYKERNVELMTLPLLVPCPSGRAMVTLLSTPMCLCTGSDETIWLAVWPGARDVPSISFLPRKSLPLFESVYGLGSLTKISHQDITEFYVQQCGVSIKTFFFVPSKPQG